MKIGILTLPQTPNYGWVLQSYALNRTLSNLGYESYFINRRWNGSPTSFVKSIQRWIYYKFFMNPFYSFRVKYIPSTRPCISDDDLKKVVKEYGFDAVIVGSDQVWRLKYSRSLKYNYFFDFIEDEKIRRIAYAPSFGTDSWEGAKEDTEIVISLLKKFNAISVRETSGINIMHDIFDMRAEQVLDPTLLLSKDDYNQILPSKKVFNHPTLVTYILDKNVNVNSLISKFADIRNESIIELIPKQEKYQRYTISVQRWLSSIRDSDFIIIDSFHGMLFSLIFQKQFLVVANKQRGLTRFYSVAKMFGIEKNIVTDIENFDLYNVPNIDYLEVNKKLEYWKSKSLDFLINALNKDGNL